MRHKKRQVLLSEAHWEVSCPAVRGAEGAQGWSWLPLGFEPFVTGGDSASAANRARWRDLPDEYLNHPQAEAHGSNELIETY